MDYRWKPEEIAAPELNNDFKWRFASDMLKPKMQIEGPSVGSLLYAINPQTSELGLKQMDSELNQQLAANEQFDKRGDAAMKFMEQRVAEDIAAKQYAEKMELENFKARNVDAGHFNSLLSNYTQALQGGNETAIAVIEDQIRKSVPNGEELIKQGREMAAKGAGQTDEFYSLLSEIPTGSMWENSDQREGFIKRVMDSNLDAKQKSEAISKARSVNDKVNYKQMQSFNARVNNTVNRSINKSNADTKNNWIDEYIKNHPGTTRAVAEKRYEQSHKE